MKYEIEIKCNNYENYKRVLNKIKFQFEEQPETNFLIENEDNFTIIFGLNKFPFIAFERDKYMQMVESGNISYEVTIKMSGDDIGNVLKYGHRIHKQLCGLQEYNDSVIMLSNIKFEDSICILISDKCNIVPLFFRDYK